MTYNQNFKTQVRSLMKSENISYSKATAVLRERKLVPMSSYSREVQEFCSSLPHNGIVFVEGDDESCYRFMHSLIDPDFMFHLRTLFVSPYADKDYLHGAVDDCVARGSSVLLFSGAVVGSPEFFRRGVWPMRCELLIYQGDVSALSVDSIRMAGSSNVFHTRDFSKLRDDLRDETVAVIRVKALSRGKLDASLEILS